MSFLPPNYTAPKANNNYMKFEKGENKFRILSNTITGYEYWTHDKKPVRLHEQPQERPADLKPRNEKEHWLNSVKHFWAMVVWNYKTESIQILQITQGGIQNKLLELDNDPDWGHPNGYDLVVNRSGEGMETKYSIVPKPHKEISKEIKKAYEDKPVNLNALYEGADPFVVTQGITEEEMINTF